MTHPVETEPKEQVSLRMLVGMPLNSEWKMHTNQSSAWKQMQILPLEQRELISVTHQGKEYIAFFIRGNSLRWEEIVGYEQDFKGRLARLFPKQDTSKVPIVIFTQLFVA